ncbi:MAG: rod shape-determining protein RodA [Bacteroidetes bacterium GWE2_29_8]|nr:MAG: rod shape-determining protein RodA [Bacteroidetes bacterium GWE2_29_8]OFY18603.1 MAG: rod shape-determining protein RodA [Bacteroidetes bacterium GWF2_29_10]
MSYIKDKRKKIIIGNVSNQLIIIYTLLVLFGWVNIYAANFDNNSTAIIDFSRNAGKQIIWIGLAGFFAIFILLIDSRFFSIFSYPVYIIIMLSLIAVIFVGKEVAGSRSWFQIGSFALQPAEFGKFATSLALSKYLSATNIRFEEFKTRIIATIIIIIPFLLILLQNDTGSALVYGFFIFVFYREGLSGNILIIGVLLAFMLTLSLIVNKYIIISCLAVVTLYFVYYTRRFKKDRILFIFAFVLSASLLLSFDYIYNNVLKTHHRDRIEVLFGKKVDEKGAGYNVIQSKIAIGSGGVIGKGFLEGTQTKYNFVPEQSTDFIFCTVGEEYGFLGSSIVVILFIYLIVQIISLSERQRSPFSRIYGYCVAVIIFAHFVINIAMAIGLLPVIGIPLPFFSYGGSSLLSFTILLFVFIKQTGDKHEII